MTNGGGLSRRTRNVLIWTAVGTIGSVGILVVLGGILLDPQGEPIIEKPETLIGTIITAFSALMAILLPAVLKAESNSEAVKDQVAPETPPQAAPVPSMRVVVTEAIQQVSEELAEVKLQVEDVKDTVDGTQSDLRGIRRDVGRVADGLRDSTVDRRQLNERLGQVERKQDEGFRRLVDMENKEKNSGPDPSERH